MEFIQYVEEWNNVSIALRLILATFFGGMIGLERRSIIPVQEHLHLSVWAARLP